jgi:hypothetical protein
MSSALNSAVELSVIDKEQALKALSHPLSYYTKFLKHLSKASSPSTTNIFETSKQNQIKLTQSQKASFNFIKVAIIENKNKKSLNSVLACFLAPAGYGKSELLKRIALLLTSLNLNYETLAYTGVAAKTCGGVTCHSFLGLNYTLKGSYEVLANHPLSKQFRERAGSLYFILLDEISFISCQFLNYIYLRLQKVKRNQKPFGGIGIIAFGDFYQIPCVIPYQLYDDSEFLPPFAKDGFNLFKQFTFLNLAENCRQVSDTRFQDLLSNIRYRRVTSDDKLFIESRLLKNLDREEISSFSKCLAIFPTNDLVNKWNERSLLSLRKPIYKINPSSQKKFLPLPSYLSLFVCKGAKIVLTKNLCIEFGLVNGTRGEVVEVVYRKHATQEDAPAFILCHFKDYSGPKCDKVYGVSVVPICQVNDCFYNEYLNISVPVKAIPLKLGYASTVHGVQSLTLEKCLIYFGHREYYLNQSYVCLSRVSTLRGFAILDSYLHADRFTRTLNKNYENFVNQLQRIGISK